jgi:hypothetical protein
LTDVIQVAAGAVNSLALVGTAPPVKQATLIAPGFGPGGFGASLPTRNGHVYRLEFKTSLTNTAWTPLSLQAGTGGLEQFSDTNAPSSGQRFYRICRW